MNAAEALGFTHRPRATPAKASLGSFFVFEALARHGRARTQQIIASFVQELARTRPELASPYSTQLDPIGVRDLRRLHQKLAGLRTFVDEAFYKGDIWRDGLSVWGFVRVAPSFRKLRVSLTVVRDEGGDGDELEAAARLQADLQQKRPFLAKGVVVRGEYCK